MIQIENLTFAYPKSPKLFDNFSLTMNSGETWGILGFNGAGKSTLIKMILGIIRPKSGHICIDGLDVVRERKRVVRTIGVVWGQKSTLWWDIPVISSYDMLRKIYHIPKTDYQMKIEKFDSDLHLSEYWNRPLRTLSLGQRIKAEIVASLLHEPETLIFDEPFIGLDFITRDKILEFLCEYKKNTHCTLLLTSHNIADIELLCQNILLINGGDVIFAGKKDELNSAHSELNCIAISHKNMRLVLPKEVEVLMQKIQRGDHSTKIIFDGQIITFQQVIEHIVQHNEVVKIESDENLLEQVIEKIIVRSEKNE